MAPTIADPSIGYGLTFKLGNSTGVLTELVGVNDIKPPNDQADREEVTHYKSPQRRKQYIDGLIDTADTTVQMNYAAGSPTDLLIQEAKNSGTPRGFEIDIPTATGGSWQITGTCVVRGYERTAPLGGKMQAVMTISYDGAITEGLASGS